MSHTPGPWETASSGVGNAGKFELTEWFVRVPESDVSIAADIIDPDTEKPSEENASLISAAPDLLAACKHVLQFDGKKIGSIGESMLRAAIAKAEPQLEVSAVKVVAHLKYSIGNQSESVPLGHDETGLVLTINPPDFLQEGSKL